MEWLAAGHMGFYGGHLAAPVNRCLTTRSGLLLEKYAPELVLKGAIGSDRERTGANGSERGRALRESTGPSYALVYDG